MLDNLTQRMARVVKTLKGQARLTEANTQDMLREIRLALIEADVALPVIRELIHNIKEKALGETVLTSLSPGQALVGIVQRELRTIISGNEEGKATELNLNVPAPVIILMAGLQGAGKTTTTGKLAKLLKEQYKKKVLTVSCDVYRPAAIAQLKQISEQAGVDFFPSSPEQKPTEIAKEALNWAKTHFHDVVLVDTAGRLGIDEAMMQEISILHQTLNPAETLFIVDAMLGQDAVNTAKAFHETLPLTGVILTKLDGDSRGGTALSVRHITGQPIKFIGVGEKLNGLEVFHPDRMTNRILGMGDILSLVEEAQRGVDLQEAEKLAKKVKKGEEFDLNDFRLQISQMNKMGGLANLVEKLPAQFQQAAAKANMGHAEKQMRRIEGIIDSMTPLERSKPDLIKATRKRRIAAGSGVHVQEVNRMLNQYNQMRTMMKKLKGGNLNKMIRGLKDIMPKMR